MLTPSSKTLPRGTFWLSGLLGAVLSACGGGGGSGGGSASQGVVSGSATSVGSPAANGSSSVGAPGAVAGGALTLGPSSCPDAIQGQAYSGCQLQASGGHPPYAFSVATDPNYPALPEGMQINASTGAVTSSLVGGQGLYQTLIVVTDAAGAQVSQAVGFAINGNNAGIAQIFPSDAIFHHRVDAASTGLPVDTSPAAAIPAVYASASIKPFFGRESGTAFPNGIPVIVVPANQALVPVATTQYQSYFTQGPIPSYAAVEGSANSSGDRHVLVYRQGGLATPAALFEMWQGVYLGHGAWTAASNAQWLDTDGDALTPPGEGTTDAAGLPIAPLLANADELIGGGSASSPAGVIRHPIRFTLNHMLNYWVWPATQTAGVGSCSSANLSPIPVEQALSQAAPPSTCSFSGAAGEIYRLKATVPTPACASASPQAAILITAMRNYGIILADNGASGGLIGTPDARWHDSDLACLKSLSLANFEPVDVSSLMLSTASAQTSH